jgi:hypothetical protein
MIKLLIVTVTLGLFALFFAALCAIPAFVLMLLLGALASVTGYAVLALPFIACFIITVIIAIFL